MNHNNNHFLIRVTEYTEIVIYVQGVLILIIESIIRHLYTILILIIENIIWHLYTKCIHIFDHKMYKYKEESSDASDVILTLIPFKRSSFIKRIHIISSMSKEYFDE